MTDNPDENTEKEIILKLQESKILFDKGECKQAIECCDEVINYYESKDNINIYFEALYNKGMALNCLDKFNEAINCYEEIVNYYKYKDKTLTYFNALYNKINALISIDKFEKAIQSCDKIINYVKNNDDKSKRYIYYFKTLYKKGIALYNLKKFEEAIECYNDIINYDTDKSCMYFEALYNKGLTVRRLGRYEEAIEVYNKITNYYEGKNNTDIYFSTLISKGYILENINKFEEAIKDYNLIINHYKGKNDKYKTYTYFTALYNQGNASNCLNQFKTAIEYYDEIIKYYKDKDKQDIYFSACYNKGYASNCLNQFDEAIESYDNIIKYYNDKEKAYYYFDSLLCKGVTLLASLTEIQTYQGKNEAIYNAFHCFFCSKKELLLIINILHSQKTDTKIIKNTVYDLVKNKCDPFFESIMQLKEINESEKERYIEIYVKSLLIINLLHTEKEERSVAHYTRKELAAKMIFEDNKMRLNSTMTANDPKEGTTLLDYLYGKQNPNNSNNKKSVNSNDTIQTFIGCFTFNHNSLNQFRLYGKEDNQEATGVSIVFKDTFFSNDIGLELKGMLSTTTYQGNSVDGMQSTITYQIDPDSLKRFSLYRCIYIDQELDKVISIAHKDDIFHPEEKSKIETKFKNYQNTLNAVRTRLEDLKTLIQNETLEKPIIEKLLLGLRYLVKDAAFKEEQECRIFSIKDIQNNEDGIIKHSEDYSRIYIEYLSVQEHMVEEIIFAPKARGCAMFQNIALLKGKEIKCRQSKLPLA